MHFTMVLMLLMSPIMNLNWFQFYIRMSYHFLSHLVTSCSRWIVTYWCDVSYVAVISPTGLEISPAKTSLKSVYLNKTMETDIDAGALLACAVTKSRSSGENIRSCGDLCIMCDRLNGTTKRHEMFLSSFNSTCLTCLQFLADDISYISLVTSQLSPPM